MRVERRHAAGIEWQPQHLEPEALDHRHPSDARQYLVDQDLVFAGAHAQLAVCIGNRRRRPEVDGELAAHQFDRAAVDLGVGDAGDAFDLVKAADRNTHARQALAEFEADGAHADDGHALGQILEFENFVCGDHPLAELSPGRGQDRRRAGCDDHRLGAKALAGCLDQGRLEQARMVLDEDIRWELGRAAAHHALDEAVAQFLHVLHRLGDIEAEPFVAVDAELPEMRPAVVRLGDVDHHLGRHAADARTRRPGRAAVDQHE